MYKDYFDVSRQWMECEMRGMSEDERIDYARKTMVCGCAINIIAIVVLLIVLSLFSSCATTQYVPVVETRTDTAYIVKQQRDSVWLHDSVHVTERGETITIERWHTKYKERTRTDTVYLSRTDSVPVPYPVTEYVAKPLTWWQTTRLHAGEVLIFLILGFAAWKLLRLR